MPGRRKRFTAGTDFSFSYDVIMSFSRYFFLAIELLFVYVDRHRVMIDPSPGVQTHTSLEEALAGQ